MAHIAKKNGKTVAQTLLRWGLQHGTSVIPKSSKAQHSQVSGTAYNLIDTVLAEQAIHSVNGRPSCVPQDGLKLIKHSTANFLPQAKHEMVCIQHSRLG